LHQGWGFIRKKIVGYSQIFNDFEAALIVAYSLGNKCHGITSKVRNEFQLRQGKKIHSPRNPQEYSWILS
jgi:hypothetical protein